MTPTPDLFGRAGDDPHHVAQESIPAHFQVHELAVPANRCSEKGPIRMCSGTPRGAKGGEVMGALEAPHRAIHRRDVEGYTHVMGARRPGRAAAPPHQPRVSVRLLTGPSTGIEGSIHHFGVDTRHVRGQSRAQPISNGLGITRGRRHEGCDLRQRVHTRVRAPAPRHVGRMAQQTSQRFFKHTLNTSSVRLDLPADEVRAHVLHHNPPASLLAHFSSRAEVRPAAPSQTGRGPRHPGRRTDGGRRWSTRCR